MNSKVDHMYIEPKHNTYSYEDLSSGDFFCFGPKDTTLRLKVDEHAYIRFHESGIQRHLAHEAAGHRILLLNVEIKRQIAQ